MPRRFVPALLPLLLLAGCNRSSTSNADSTPTAVSSPTSPPRVVTSATPAPTPVTTSAAPAEDGPSKTQGAEYATVLLGAPGCPSSLDPAAPLLGPLEVKNDMGCGCWYGGTGELHGKPLLIYEDPSVVLVGVRGTTLALARTGGPKDSTGDASDDPHIYECDGLRIEFTTELVPSDCDDNEDCTSSPSTVAIRAIQGTATMSLRGRGECGC